MANHSLTKAAVVLVMVAIMSALLAGGVMLVIERYWAVFVPAMVP